MSTPPSVPAQPQKSLLDRILAIADLAAQATESITAGTPIAAGASIADLLIQMGQHAKSAYEAETGQPYDLDKIPFEEPVPDPNAPPAGG